MVSPLASIVAGLGPQRSGVENLGQNIQGLALGNQQRQINDQRIQENDFNLQQQKVGAQRQEKQLNEQDAGRQLQFLNRLGKQLLSQDESRWGQLLTPHLPVLSAMGYTSEALQGMNREQIQDVVVQTDAVIGQADQEGQTAAQKERSSLLQDLQSDSEQVRDSAAVSLGLKGRATGAAPQIVMIGGAPYEYDKQQKKLVRAEVNGQQIDAQVVADDRATIVGAETEAEVGSKGKADRSQSSIQSGIDAAKGIPVLRRTLELLNSVNTGGFSSASLKAKQMFGIESANEGELSANLGEAVLGDLKQTFGAAFTEKEGQRLERIRAGFGKSPETNRRLIGQSIQIATDAAQRAMREAGESGDYETAQRIKDVLEFKLKDQPDENVENSPSQILRFDAQGNPI